MQAKRAGSIVIVRFRTKAVRPCRIGADAALRHL